MDDFKTFLIGENLSSNTVSAYITAVKGFKQQYEEITKKNLFVVENILDRKLQSKNS